MTYKQKSYYKSLLLTLIGLALWIGGLISAIIFGSILDNSFVIVVCVVISLLGLITFILDNNFSVIFQLHFHTYPNLFYKYVLYGVPNNTTKDFNINANEIYHNSVITFHEEINGLFKSIINGKVIVLDLKGWHNKGYCLYEYFMSIIQIDLSNKNYKKMKKSIYTNKVSDLTLEISFVTGKKKKYILIKNNNTILMKKFKHRLGIIHDCIKKEKIVLNDLFDFNIK